MRTPFTASIQTTVTSIHPERKTDAEVQQYIIIVLNALFSCGNILFEMLLKTICRVFLGGIISERNQIVCMK